MNFQEWFNESLNQISVPNQWKKRYGELEKDIHYGAYNKKDIANLLSQGRKNAIDMHKNNKGPVVVYHSFIPGRDFSSIFKRISDIVTQSKDRITDEEISVSVKHGPWMNCMVLEGLATLLAYWDQDVHTISRINLKYPTVTPETLNKQNFRKDLHWDEALIPINKVKWYRLWYDPKHLDLLGYSSDEKIIEQDLYQLGQKLGLEIRPITGNSKEIPDRREKFVINYKNLSNRAKKLREISNTMLIRLEVEGKLSDNRKEQLQFLQFHQDYDELGDYGLGKLIQNWTPYLKKLWSLYSENIFSRAIEKVLMTKNTLSASDMKPILSFDFIVKNISFELEKSFEAYREIFRKAFKIEPNTFLNDLLNKYPDSDDIKRDGDQELKYIFK